MGSLFKSFELVLKGSKIKHFVLMDTGLQNLIQDTFVFQMHKADIILAFKAFREGLKSQEAEHLFSRIH